MKKIAIVGVGASALYARAVIEAEKMAQESGSQVLVVGADASFEMDPEEVKQKLMEVAHANEKLTLDKSQVYTLSAQPMLDLSYIPKQIQNKPFYYGVPKSKKRGRKA